MRPITGSIRMYIHYITFLGQFEKEDPLVVAPSSNKLYRQPLYQGHLEYPGCNLII